MGLFRKKNIKKEEPKVSGSLDSSYYNGLSEYNRGNVATGLSIIEAVASSGLVKAQLFLAGEYYSGVKVKQSFDKAIYWYQKAAEQGNSDAQYVLGVLMNIKDNETGCNRQSIYWLEKAVNNGNTKAMNELAALYYTGTIVEQSIEKTVQLLEKSASLGNGEACCRIGEMYFNGIGVDCSYSNAAFFFNKGAELNDPHSMYNLGLLYEDGTYYEKDEDKAFDYYFNAADLGEPYAQARIGKFYLGAISHSLLFKKTEKIYEYTKEALKWINKSVEQNCEEGYYLLGCCYRDGTGVVQSKTRADELIMKAADMGSSDAAYWVGRAYYEGIDCPKSIEKAIQYFKIAADKNDKDSMAYLGECYETYSQKDVDNEEALYWYKRAIEDGENDHLLLTLGQMYYYGYGAHTSYVEGVKWFEKASEKRVYGADYELGFAYYHGCGVEKSIDKAIECFERAVQNYDYSGYYGLGAVYNLRNDISKMIEYYQKGCEKGNTLCLFEMGWRYYKGDKVEKSVRLADEYLTKAAENHSLLAQKNIAWIYYKREFGINDEKAFHWFSEASKRGDVMSTYGLAYMYYEGRGTEQSYSIAANLLLSSDIISDDGIREFYLGKMYEEGWGFDKNKDQALKWYREAATGYNNGEACYKVASILESDGITSDNIEDIVKFYSDADYYGYPIDMHHYRELIEMEKQLLY